MNNGTMNHEALDAKAHAVLKARMPHLSEHSLNFEKRTGNFFTASVVEQEDGTAKLTRKVVEDANIAAECYEEMKQKRAAALVLSYEAKRNTACKAIEEAAHLLAECEENLQTLNADYAEAVAIVEALELPEKAERVTLTAKVEAQSAEIERLKALLASAGIEA